MTLDGPFEVYDLATAVTTTGEDGFPVTAYQPASGVHYNTDAASLAVHPELQPYVVDPPTLQRVFAGDDPANPAWTVALRFPDQETADEVLAPLLPAA